MNLTKEFWEKAYKENASLMLGVCRRYVQNKEVAEDLMQDAFLSAMNKSESYSGTGSFNGWLRKIAVNTSLMYLRNERSKKISADLISNESEYQNIEEPNAADIKSVIEEADFSDLELLEAIEKLPEHHRLVFNLYVIDNYTHVQIGKELNISTGTSKSHLARARKKIQQHLYEKALDRNTNKKKKQSALMLMLFTGKPDYIDKLFSDKLANLSVKPMKGSDSLLRSVRWEKVTIPEIRTGLFSGNAGYGITGLTTGIVVISAFLYFSGILKKSPSNETNSLSKIIADSIGISPVQKQSIPSIISDTTAGKLKQAAGKKKQVVVKKTIIHHRTITVRDTIRIKDSTDAK